MEAAAELESGTAPESEGWPEPAEASLIANADVSDRKHEQDDCTDEKIRSVHLILRAVKNTGTSRSVPVFKRKLMVRRRGAL
jgi:hypothetical protein